MNEMNETHYSAGRSTAPHYATDGHPYYVSTYSKRKGTTRE